MSRRSRTVALALGLALAAGGLGAAPAAGSASGSSYGSVTLFPSDELTVPDARQLTGRRVHLAAPGCPDRLRPTVCGLARRINQLDGFDLDPRVAIGFGRPVSVNAVRDATTLSRVGAPAGERPIALERFVYDEPTGTVYAHPVHQLAPGTTYRLRVRGGQGVPAASTTFTTLSATDGLLDLRRQLSDGTAYAAAGIPVESRGLRVDATVPAAGTQFAYVRDEGRVGLTEPVPAPSLVSGTVVFGSFLAPRWLRADRTIEQTPTGDAGPAARGRSRLPFVLVVPPGRAPAGGWPTAVYGHGFTRTVADVLLTASVNSRNGLATIATTVAGHGYGPRSTWTYSRADGVHSLPAYGRGVDLDGNGVIDSTEGSGTRAVEPEAAVGSRDGLRQTAADVMTLVRAVRRDGASLGLRPSRVSYYGHSFGGIYGTMVAGADHSVYRASLTAAGGPITEVVRLGNFRPLLIESLKVAGLIPADATDFQESMPLRGQRVTDPAFGALAIQDYLADTTWLNRPGSPETFAPLVRDSRSLFQVAYGDGTVPNPTSYTVLEAGGLFERASVFRNDRLATSGENPHNFLINPLMYPVAFRQGQRQVLRFLRDGETLDPDGRGGAWQVPLPYASLLRRTHIAPSPAP